MNEQRLLHKNTNCNNICLIWKCNDNVGSAANADVGALWCIQRVQCIQWDWICLVQGDVVYSSTRTRILCTVQQQMLVKFRYFLFGWRQHNEIMLSVLHSEYVCVCKCVRYTLLFAYILFTKLNLTQNFSKCIKHCMRQQERRCYKVKES